MFPRTRPWTGATSPVRHAPAWWPVLLCLLGAAAVPGSQSVDVPVFLSADENQSVKQNKDRLRDRAVTEAVRQVCGEDVEDSRLLALTGNAGDVQRTFLRRTSVRARGRVLGTKWIQEPRSEEREGRDGYSGVLQAQVVCEPPRPPAFSLDLAIRGAKPDLLPLFKVGETVELTCRASTRARAMLFALGSDQRVVPVVPSPYMPRLDLVADSPVSVPGPEDRVTLEVSAPPTPGTWLEAFKLVAFKADNLPPPPAVGPDGTIAPADFEKWLFATPADVREEAVVAYQVVGQEGTNEP